MGWNIHYHAIHESAHAVVGYRLRLTPKKVTVGKTSTGTSGNVEFCSNAALQRDPERYLVIAVAGQAGTRVLGYENRLVSESLARLHDDEEPGWMSDEMFVWEGDYSLTEIRAAEAKARKILKRNGVLLTALAESLIAKRELGKDEIRRVFAKSHGGC